MKPAILTVEGGPHAPRPSCAIRAVFVTTGLHGNEHTPIEAGWILKQRSGEIRDCFDIMKIFQGINENGLRACTRDTPEMPKPDKEKDLNRWRDSYVHPRDYIRTHILNKAPVHGVNMSTSLLIDIHASSNCVNCVLLDEDAETTPGFVDICIANDIPYLVRETQGFALKREFERQSPKHCLGITYECNGLAGAMDTRSAQMAVEHIIKIIKAVAKGFKMKTEWPYKCYSRTANARDGMVYSRCDPAARGKLLYKQGDPIAVVKGYDGEVIEEVLCPVDGIYINGPADGFAKAGSEFFIQPLPGV